MKEGDKVKVISTPAGCNKGCQLDKCKFLDQVGTIYKMNYSGVNIYVRDFSSNSQNGCSGFKEEDLQEIIPIVQYLPMESAKKGDYVKLIGNRGMTARIGSIARLTKAPHIWSGNNAKPQTLISVEWRDKEDTGLRRGQHHGGYRAEDFEVLNMKVLATVYSKTHPDQKYEIRLGNDGVTYCTCWAWKKNRTCKHLEGFFLELERLKPSASKPIEPKTTLEVEVSQAVKEAVATLRN